MLKHYLGDALRTIGREPAAAFILGFTMMVGLLCFMAAHLFSHFVSGADAHWDTADRIRNVTQTITVGDGRPNELELTSPPLAKYLRQDAPAGAVVARLSAARPVELAANGQNFAAMVSAADPQILDVFGARLQAGAAAPGLAAPGSAFITAEAATRIFGGAEAALGRQVDVEILHRTSVAIVGVLPPISDRSALRGPARQYDLMVSNDVLDTITAPVFYTPDGEREDPRVMLSAFPGMTEQESWTNSFASTFVLLPEDGAFSDDDLQAALDRVSATHVRADAGPVRFGVETLASLHQKRLSRMAFQDEIGISAQQAIYGLGLVLLLIALTNCAIIAAAAVTRRARAIGIKKTLGAGWADISAETLAASVLLNLGALALVAGLTAAAQAALLAQGVLETPYVPSAPGFWLGVAGILAGGSLLMAAYPAWLGGGVSPVATQQAVRVGGGGRFQIVLMTAQFVVTGALLSAVIVIFAQNRHLSEAIRGIEADRVVLLEGDNVFGPRFETVRRELLADPSVAGATGVRFEMFASAASQDRIGLTAQSAMSALSGQEYQPRAVSYDFFSVLGVPLVVGREFADGEATADRVIIDVATARNLGLTPDEAIGKTIFTTGRIVSMRAGGEMVSERRVTGAEIIGVVENPPFEIGAGQNHVYSFTRNAQLIVRLAEGDRDAMLARLDARWGELADTSLASLRLLSDEFAENFTLYRRISGALATIVVLGVSLACAGMFGVASFVLERKRHEVGVRKTFGASTRQISALVLWDISRPVLAASLLSIPLAWILASAYLQMFADRVALSPWPFAAGVAACLLFAWASAGAHVLRLARTRPLEIFQAA